MKEITRIHLAQAPYNIELAAKKELEKYLAAIEKLLGTDADTMREIEARMGELLSERGVSGEKVITTHDVAELKARLGEPGEFADESVAVSDRKKRFMRDERRGVIGGVLSGLSAYTSVDVVWYRIAAIVLALMSFGTMVLVYIVLWIAVPPARTAAERLQMRGDVPNLENIQEEANVEAVDRPARTKPFIMLIRVLGVLGFVGAAVGALALVAIALGVSIPVIGNYDWLVNGWLIAALIVASMSGILFAVLMGVLGYSAGTWRMSKSLVMTMIVITVIGLASFGTSLGLGMYGGQQLHSNVEAHTKVARTSLEQLKDAEEIKVSSTGVSWTSVRYVVTTAEPYAEACVLQRSGVAQVPIQVTREGTVATINTKQNETNPSSCYGLWSCDAGARELTIYGPAVKSVHATEGTVQYEAKQQTLHVEIAQNANVILAGTVASLDGSIAAGGGLLANGAAVDHVVLAVEQGSTIELGTVQTIALTVPASCGAEIENRITYTRAQEITVNGAAWHEAEARQLSCAVMERRDDSAAPGMVY